MEASFPEAFFEDEYVLLESLGHGSYGEVFKARERATGNLVAAKRIEVAPNFHRERTELYSELEVLGVRSPYLVEVHKLMASRPTISEKRFVFLVMELLDGCISQLFRYSLGRSGTDRMRAADYVHVARQVLQGLEALHRRNLVHGDLHRSNVLFDRDGFVRLCDFGKTTFALSAGDRPKLGPHQGGRGYRDTEWVPIFMRPPELLLGSLEVDPAIDMWCFGFLLLQLAVGTHDFLDLPYSHEWSSDNERRYSLRVAVLRSYAALTGHSPCLPGGAAGLPAAARMAHHFKKDLASYLREKSVVLRPEVPRRLAAAKAELGPHWWPMVLRCLDPDPAKRPKAAHLLSSPFFPRIPEWRELSFGK